MGVFDRVKGMFGGRQEQEFQLLPQEDMSLSDRAKAKAAEASQELEKCCDLTYTQRIGGFVLALIGGLIMLTLAFFYVTRIFIGQPTKFAFTYCLANILILTSSCFLVGPCAQLKSMFAEERRIASAVYMSTMLLTLYFCWQLPYFWLVVPALVVQFVALLWYVLSYVPFGRAGMARACNWMTGKSILPI